MYIGRLHFDTIHITLHMYCGETVPMDMREGAWCPHGPGVKALRSFRLHLMDKWTARRLCTRHSSLHAAAQVHSNCPWHALEPLKHCSAEHRASYHTNAYHTNVPSYSGTQMRAKVEKVRMHGKDVCTRTVLKVLSRRHGHLELWFGPGQ